MIFTKKKQTLWNVNEKESMYSYNKQLIHNIIKYNSK